MLKQLNPAVMKIKIYLKGSKKPMEAEVKSREFAEMMIEKAMKEFHLPRSYFKLVISEEEEEKALVEEGLELIKKQGIDPMFKDLVEDIARF